MRKVRRRAKKGFTLVETIVAMSLTAIFLASCVVLILPIEKIYTRVNDESRAQILADTVVNSLRAECSGACILSADDVRVVNSGASGPISENVVSSYGNVLILRKSNAYFETISANYCLTSGHRTAVLNNDDAPVMDETTSRAVYRMSFDSVSASDSVSAGRLHYGYFGTGSESQWVPYDFTNPLVSGAYGNMFVRLTFGTIQYGTDGVPDYVTCTVTILDRDGVTLYTRQTVLCF